MPTYKYPIVLGICLGIFVQFAQANDPLKNEVTVTKSYEPHLTKKVDKVPFKVTSSDSLKIRPEINLDLKNFTLAPESFTPPSLSKLSTAENSTFSPADFTLESRLGLGSRLSPLASIQMAGRHSLLGKWHSSIDHFSEHADIRRFNGLKSDNHQSLSDLEVGSSWVITNNFLMEAQAAYQHRYHTAYGYSDEQLGSIPHQAYNQWTGALRFSNITRDLSDWKHHATLQLYLWNDAFGNTENAFTLNAGTEKRRNENERMGIRLRWDQTFLSSSQGSFAATAVQIMPYYTLRFDRFLASAQLNLAFDNRAKYNFIPYLNVKLSYEADPQGMATAFVALEGEHDPNSLRELSRINPYLAPDFDKALSTSYRIGLRFGLEGCMGGIFAYRLSQAFKKIDNSVFFMNYPNEWKGNEAFFAIAYDDISVLETLLEADYRILPDLHAKGNLWYRGYRMDALDHPYQMPAVEAKISLDYKLYNKLKFKLIGHYYGDFYGNDPSLAEVKVPSSFNLSLYTSYDWHKGCYVWLNFDNLLNKKNHSFYRYNSYGIGVMAGIGFRF